VVKLAPDKFVPSSFDDFEIAQARRELFEGRGIYGRD
jgi:hypothetical protein